MDCVFTSLNEVLLM